MKAVYICLNKVAPDYLGKEVGVGESLILKAMAETYGRTEANLKKGNQWGGGEEEHGGEGEEEKERKREG